MVCGAFHFCTKLRKSVNISSNDIACLAPEEVVLLYVFFNLQLREVPDGSKEKNES